MPTPLLVKVNWDLIYPPFMVKCFELAAKCKARGFEYYAISGYRSFPDQAKLYFQGRTTPGPIVTKARPGMSAHNYGVAVDWCLDKNVNRAGLQPDWDINKYRVIQEESERLGLESGMSWKTFKEGPHVQLPLTAKGITFMTLKREHDLGGTKAVFRYLDSKGPW